MRYLTTLGILFVVSICPAVAQIPGGGGGGFTASVLLYDISHNAGMGMMRMEGNGVGVVTAGPPANFIVAVSIARTFPENPANQDTKKAVVGPVAVGDPGVFLPGAGGTDTLTIDVWDSPGLYIGTATVGGGIPDPLTGEVGVWTVLHSEIDFKSI